MFIFGGGNKEINTHEDEIKKLKLQNKTLLDSNSILKVNNDNLNVRFGELNDSISNIDSSLNNNGNSISDLEDEKGKISDNVRVLSADGVAGELSEYLVRSTFLLDFRHLTQ